MQTYGQYHIEEMPLGSPFFRNKVERFLQANGLRMETPDVYYTLQNKDDAILAGAGLSGDVIQCVAVAPEARQEGLVAPLLSHILSQHGPGNLKVFTKPENEAVFASLGFHVIARAPLAILMENGRGLEAYCAYLRALCPAPTGHLSTGVVVMNANPFTLGHRYLLEQAARQVDRLFVIPVKETPALSGPGGVSFSYPERLAMIRAGAPSGVVVAEGSCYQISALTFPTYFLKDLSTAAETQMRLDLDLFARHIAPALGASVRFVGSEPLDPLTARYNALMAERLQVVEIPRLCHSERSEESPVSASAVRAFLHSEDYASASALCPVGTHPYLLAHLACQALRRELDCPLKPGLVGPGSCGAHTDMDYALMLKSISALRPWFAGMASAGSPRELRQLGISAEKAMLEATGGVNTHRGAIFALGLALYARGAEMVDNEKDMQKDLGKIAGVIFDNSLLDKDLPTTHGAEAQARFGVEGARGMARSGYADLFVDWLPYYRSFAGAQDDKDGNCHSERSEESRLQALLLRIMSTLDDTCVIHRVGYDRAQQVKSEAAGMLRAARNDNPARNGLDWKTQLNGMCDRYAAEGISPGGAADMLALTLFIHSIIP